MILARRSKTRIACLVRYRLLFPPAAWSGCSSVQVVDGRTDTAEVGSACDLYGKKLEFFARVFPKNSPYTEWKLEFWAKTRVFRFQNSVTWQTRNVRLPSFEKTKTRVFKTRVFFSYRVGLSWVSTIPHRDMACHLQQTPTPSHAMAACLIKWKNQKMVKWWFKACKRKQRRRVCPLFRVKSEERSVSQNLGEGCYLSVCWRQLSGIQCSSNWRMETRTTAG